MGNVAKAKKWPVLVLKNAGGSENTCLKSSVESHQNTETKAENERIVEITTATKKCSA